MTLPSEEKNAIKYTRDFLLSLLNPKETPRVPSFIRKEARRLLKHFPFPYRIDELYKHGARAEDNQSEKEE